jgi:hypothetical protein
VLAERPRHAVDETRPRSLSAVVQKTGDQKIVVYDATTS